MTTTDGEAFHGLRARCLRRLASCHRSAFSSSSLEVWVPVVLDTDWPYERCTTEYLEIRRAKHGARGASPGFATLLRRY